MKQLAASVVMLALLVAPARAALVISSAATSNVSCASGVCSATAADAVLNAADLAGLLASSDVAVESGSAAQDIEVDASFSWTSANRLTLDAFRGIAVDAPVVVAGPGGMTIATDDGGTGGDFAFASGASADFWDNSSSLVVNGRVYVLEAGLPALASAAEANPSGNYALAKSYDASADGTYRATPMPGVFSGNVEGLGHTISNLTIRTPLKKSAGLFEQFAQSAVLRDLSLANASVRGGLAAGLVVNNSGEIIQCSVGGTVEGAVFVGGIIGRGLDGYILRAHAAVTMKPIGGSAEVGGIAGEMEFNSSGQGNPIQGIYQSDASGSVAGWDAGGLVGHLLEDIVDHSHAAVKVNGVLYAGGIAGTGYGTIQYSSASGSVRVADNGYAGGLVGNLLGAVTLSFATGNARGGNTSNVGGLVGGSIGWISDAYAMGKAEGGTNSNVGGLAGKTGPTETMSVVQSYSIGAPRAGGSSVIGGLVADGSLLEPSADYFDVTTSHMPAKDGVGICGFRQQCRRTVLGLHDSELRAALPTGLSTQYWAQSAAINNGYPYLIANPPQP
jgi:hypothetical protein